MPYLMLCMSALFWSGNFVLSRGVHASIPPVGLSFWRWVAAFLILLPFGLPHLRRGMGVILQNKRYMLIQALMGISLFNTLIYIAVNYTTAINAVLVNSCIPVIIVIISWVMFRETISLRQAFGVLMSFAGIVYIISKGDINNLRSLSFNIGDLVVLMAAFVWAGYSVNLRRFPAGLHPLAYLTGIMFIGIICLTPVYIAEVIRGRLFEINIQSAASILYVALFASVLAFIFWNRAVREVGANRAGPFVHLMPVFSIILAVVFLNEFLVVYHIKGMIAVFTGILLATVRLKRS